MAGAVAHWLDPVLGLLFPAVCPVCARRTAEPRPRPFCPPCWAALPRIEAPVCARCGVPYPGLGDDLVCDACRRAPPAFPVVRAAAVYRDGVRLAVHALKYRRRPALARPLGDLLADQVLRLLPAPPAALAEALVPVPLHPARLAERGYNQAALLAAAAARRLGLPVWSDALVRRRATRPQTDLDGSARRANVAGAFAVPRPRRVAGRRLLLVDDVLTTGATVTAAGAALREAGAEAAGVLVLARPEAP